MKNKRKQPFITFEKYEDQFQVGLALTIHKHLHYHFHLWIDLGFWCIEVTIGDSY